MPPLVNAPENFTSEMLEGFVDANRNYVRRVPGGVIRSNKSTAGKVSVVIGGGSGHYPAFIGYVGHGLADGAVAGNLFASPSSQQIVQLAKAVDNGGGLFFAFGNYAGDVLNFNLAGEQLREDGFDTRILAVTDDVASAPPTQMSLRRGIAGDVVVFKLIGAAAEAGYDIDGVERIAIKANERTRSLGVAFTGCTLPGSTSPLFNVPKESIAVGMGIHGEPGIGMEATCSADALAELLVTQLLNERPAESSDRVVAILNGLGGTKYEELFVLWRKVSQLLSQAGLTAVRPEVGELVTSLNMEGCSLTLTWLDDELEELWMMPADSPAFRRGASSEGSPIEEMKVKLKQESGPAQASEISRNCANTVLAVFEAINSALQENEEILGSLDAVAGDGDHGRGMTRGCGAALLAIRAAIDYGSGMRTTVLAAGEAWGDRAGGTSGALWGQGLIAFAQELNDETTPSAQDISNAITTFQARVQKLGGAQLGDKTLVDSLHAFVVNFATAVNDGYPLNKAWAGAASEATKAAQETAAMTARLGRARPLGVLSQGSPDPGAVSMAICLNAVASVLR